jgi:phenylalanyl-tRNA synthetase beta chain
VTTLDNQTRTLDEQMVLIADGDGPTSIAGVMGGARSEVHDGTTRVLMEAANWNGPNIHRTSLKLGLRSEASGRFEKGLQPEQTLEAQSVAARLMIELCGARLLPGTIDVGGPGPELKTIRLRDERVTALLGIEIPRARCAGILQALEFDVGSASDGLDVTVPPFRRADVTREADLIEEVARLGALETLPATLPSRHGASGRLTPRQRLRRRASDMLAAQGLNEVVGWSFASPDLARKLRLPGRPAVRLQNAMSSEQSQLRSTLLGSLLDIASRNRDRGAGAIRLFEAGAVYLPSSEPLPDEPYHVAIVLGGPGRRATWRDPSPPGADFFTAKGVLTGLLDGLQVKWRVEPAPKPQPFLHPGRAARLMLDGDEAGWIGEIHPRVAGEWGWSDPLAAFELDLDAVAGRARVAHYRDLTSFPEVHEDLAVIVADRVSAADVLAVVRDAGAPLLRDASVFDVYRDAERIGEGNVSLALRLTFGVGDRTLTDEEVAAKRGQVSLSLAERLQGRVRDS